MTFQNRRADDEATCRSCGETILWVTMYPSGKKNCLNPVPQPGGNVERKRGVINREKWYGRVIPDIDQTGPLYLSHFATCPNASGWRRR